MATTLAPALLLKTTSLDHLTRGMFDETFAGIYQPNWFDLALTIPYFALVGFLAIYGFHRYLVIWRYWRRRKEVLATPPGRLDELPRVTIQLPLYNERYVVGRLLEAVTRISYPRGLLQIQVLDDSTDETHPHTERLVGEYRSRGFPIEYHHRTHREGFKAGALAEGLKKATGELIAIFDADFTPPQDFLERTVHFFADPQVGCVQTRWTYTNRDYSVLTEVQAILLDGHFVLEHTARCGSGLFFNFNGTGGVMRRRMIEDAGGWEHDTLTEDSDLSYRAQLKGWKFAYVPTLECPSELPVETYSFQVQQSRWAKGLTQCAMKLLPRILRAPVPFRQKLEAFFHLTPNITYPIMIVVAALMLPVMIVRFYVGWFQMLLLDMPLVILTFISIIAFYVLSQRELQPNGGWKRAILLMPILVAAGVALTVVNARAVMEALLRIPSAFVRTAKYAISGNQPMRVERAKYRRKSGWLPYVELGFGCYFLAMVAYCIDTYNFLALPFLLMFVGGYFWAGATTLYDEYRDRLRRERERAVSIEAAE
ncbi:MAG: glycosyltransferase [Bryobacteraceae bacterium]|nr:glycosyltransferase [Bryobacteraceae bacterium]